MLGEVFRAHGYEGATLALITQATGLGKGSLYHFFPGGKQQMAAEVLDEIDRWFEVNIFAPLRQTDAPEPAVAAMIRAVEDYFRSGHQGLPGRRHRAWRFARYLCRPGARLFRALA